MRESLPSLVQHVLTAWREGVGEGRTGVLEVDVGMGRVPSHHRFYVGRRTRVFQKTDEGSAASS